MKMEEIVNVSISYLTCGDATESNQYILYGII